MLLNTVPFHSVANILDCQVELACPTSSSSISVNSTPSPSYSKSSTSPNKALFAIREKRSLDLPCAICSSPATGYHYSVASCNGCKTFFRRCVLSKSSFQCIRSDSSCLSDSRSPNNGSRIKCRSCRLDRCFEQGMRKEAVTSNLQPDMKSSIDIYFETITQPRTSETIDRVTETAACLRQTIHLISKFRRCNIHREEINISIQTALSNVHFLDNISNYKEVKDFKNFNRVLPDWFTLDLASSIEFAKKIPDLELFTDEDKEELIRSSCLTVAIAIQAIDSYFADQKRITLPDGSDIIERSLASTSMNFNYLQTFILILEPLYRGGFTIDEIVLSMQLLFFSIASHENLSENGKKQLEKSIDSSMRTLFILLIVKDKSTFTTRYGSLVAMNEVFIKVAAVHKTKMQENQDLRRKHHDILIEQIVFDLRL